MTEFRQSDQQLLIYFPRFSVSGEGRLKAWGISYKIDRKAVGTGPKLVRVVEDYPLPTRYRLVAKDVTGPAK